MKEEWGVLLLLGLVVAAMVGGIWWAFQPEQRRTSIQTAHPGYIVRCGTLGSGQLTVVKLDDASIYVTC